MNKPRLLQLASYLEALPSRTTRFNMGWYRHDKNIGMSGPSNLPIECGSSACALGHAPQVGPGLEVLPTDKDWPAYGERIFGLGMGTTEYLWCFGGMWAAVDNTPKGAAARIRWLVEKGLPEDAMEQICGNEPYCYRVIALWTAEEAGVNGQTFNDPAGYHRIDVVQTIKGWLVTHRVHSFMGSTSGAATSISVHSIHVEDEQHAMRITDFKPEDFT